MGSRHVVGAGTIIHVIKRGARGMNIVRDDLDRDRFVDTLLYLNDTYSNENWYRELSGLPRFARPARWPERNPLVDILAWTLLDNHIHILLNIRESQEHGVSMFAQRLFRSMTGYFNEKYGGTGTIFQGPYTSVIIEDDDQLRYVIPYIMFKNVLEMHPDGFDSITREMDASWKWAIQYPYSSLFNYVQAIREPGSHILAENNIIHQMYPHTSDLKHSFYDMLEAYCKKRDSGK